MDADVGKEVCQVRKFRTTAEMLVGEECAVMSLWDLEYPSVSARYGLQAVRSLQRYVWETQRLRMLSDGMA